MVKCFVIMPFEEPFHRYYQEVFAPAIRKAKLTPLRADEIEKPGVIVDQIWRGIQEAEVLLADLTGRNANVMYELGLAHALGKPVVQLVQSVTDLPFDLKALRHIIYRTDVPRWDEKLSKEITQMLLQTMRDPKSCSVFQSARRHPITGVTDREARQSADIILLGPPHTTHVLKLAIAKVLRMCREQPLNERYDILVSCVEAKIEQQRKTADRAPSNNENEETERLLARAVASRAETILAEFELHMADNPSDDPIKVFRDLVEQWNWEPGKHH
ncbi:hypothetical protein ACFLXE_07155 [Chloroflexota bacterium]